MASLSKYKYLYGYNKNLMEDEYRLFRTYSLYKRICKKYESDDLLERHDNLSVILNLHQEGFSHRQFFTIKY